MIRKYTGKRDTDKKEYFLNWQIKKINSCYIPVIKSPNPPFGKLYIPENKNGGNNKIGSKECLKIPVKIEFWMK